ncbi:MAG TPA: lipopolysaccharide biosynthesis protein [Jatrophihabitantaceae bacterium]
MTTEPGPAPRSAPRHSKAKKKSYGSGARILSLGIASTGVLSFLYLALASRELSASDYGRVSLLWSITFVILSVLYRPIEQLLSRTIADRRARGLHEHPLRTPALIQAAFAVAFLIAALALRTWIEKDLFDGRSGLYWILVVAVLAYAGSYFARGWLAGHEHFAGYGGLVLLESTSRFLFAVAAVAGIITGPTPIAIGIAVAPFVSMTVVPFAIRRMRHEHAAPPADPDAVEAAAEAADAAVEDGVTELSLRHGSRFAVSVFAIMLAEQSLMNAAVLIVQHDSGPALAGFVFNVLLIVRVPLQLFQAVQTSILPHLTGMEARDQGAGVARAIRITVTAITAFAGVCALGLLAIGPWAMHTVLGDKGFTYERGGLALVAVGMGFHLVAGTLNQAALARGRAASAAAAWLLCAALFVVWVASSVVKDEVLRVETGYAMATFLLSGLLYVLHRRATPTARPADPVAQPAG